MQAFSAAASCVPYTRSLSALNKVETLLLIEIIFLKCNDVETNCHFNYRSLRMEIHRKWGGPLISSKEVI